MILQILLPIVGTLLFYILFHASQIIYRNLSSPLRYIGGPKNHSIIFGNMKQMGDDAYLTTKWRAQYGPIFRFRGPFSMNELHTSDIKSVNHIVTNPTIYQKPKTMLASAAHLLGGGILSVESDEHKRHRRALNPAFGVSQIRQVTEIFNEKGVQLRELWNRELSQSNGGKIEIEVLSWMRRLTLDVIGQAGFNYQFNALEPKGKPNELSEVFSELFHSPHANSYARYRIAQAIIPLLKFIPGPGYNVVLAARHRMLGIGRQIVSASKAKILATPEEKTLTGKRDLLSTLLKANLSTAIPDTQRLNDREVIAQIPNFFLAGHETTSSAVSWALYALSEHPLVQKALREELLSLPTDNPTMDELNALPYLEQVVRETMRVHAPAVFTQRIAVADDVLPLSKPYIDKDGKSHDSLAIAKGQMIHIPILAINTDPEIWGDDAAQFKPERWENLPESVSVVPGVWANLFTFFAGPHNCIGFRFSLAELKALLFILIRAFEFEPAVAKGDIIRVTTGLLQRPTVRGKGHHGSGLPLMVRQYNAAEQ
ncbi:cytochrome P450 [Favolaschia claudopus]|uniref:Cytochrome P450 n=1 Tax=Favolaschia claudopus TaxID=2862362 RepID=A0AAW0DLW0_9AGAR